MIVPRPQVPDPAARRALAETGPVDTAQTRGLPATPRAGRHIELTRTGRRITRRTDGVAALHRDPATEHITELIARFDTEGELLVLGNYRCRHSRDAHTGARTVHSQTVRTDDAQEDAAFSSSLRSCSLDMLEAPSRPRFLACRSSSSRVAWPGISPRWSARLRANASPSS
jgi:hypothetical protein